MTTDTYTAHLSTIAAELDRLYRIEADAGIADHLVAALAACDPTDPAGTYRAAGVEQAGWRVFCLCYVLPDGTGTHSDRCLWRRAVARTGAP